MPNLIDMMGALLRSGQAPNRPNVPGQQVPGLQQIFGAPPNPAPSIPAVPNTTPQPSYPPGQGRPVPTLNPGPSFNQPPSGPLPGPPVMGGPMAPSPMMPGMSGASPLPASIPKPDDGLVDYLKSWEGFRGRPEVDLAGHSTVGYGHRIQPGESYKSLSKDDADALLRQDTSDVQSHLRSFIPHFDGLPPSQQHALTSLAFNTGVENIPKWSAYAAARQGDMANAAVDMLSADKYHDPKTGKLESAKGLTKRRIADAALMLNTPNGLTTALSMARRLKGISLSSKDTADLSQRVQFAYPQPATEGEPDQ